MNKTDLLSKYKHQLILRSYSKNTVNAYLSSLNNFLLYVKKKRFKDISDTQVEDYFYYCKAELNYSYATMKQNLSVQEVQRRLNSFTNVKHKAIFTLCYSETKE